MSAGRFRMSARPWIMLSRPRFQCRKMQRDTCGEEWSTVRRARVFPAAPATGRSREALRWRGVEVDRVRWPARTSNPLGRVRRVRWVRLPPSSAMFLPPLQNGAPRSLRYPRLTRIPVIRARQDSAQLSRGTGHVSPPRSRSAAEDEACAWNTHPAGSVCLLRVDSRRARQGSTHAIRICEPPRATGAS